MQCRTCHVQGLRPIVQNSNNRSRVLNILSVPNEFIDPPAGLGVENILRNDDYHVLDISF